MATRSGGRAALQAAFRTHPPSACAPPASSSAGWVGHPLHGGYCGSIFSTSVVSPSLIPLCVVSRGEVGFLFSHYEILDWGGGRSVGFKKKITIKFLEYGVCPCAWSLGLREARDERTQNVR